MSDSHLRASNSPTLQPQLARKFMSLEVGSLSPTLAPQPRFQQTPLINRLPTELLSYILSLTLRSLSTDNSTVDGYRRWGYSFPAIPSLVCRKWRKIALETPHLWTYITIQSRTPFSHLSDRIVRSGVLPLDVEVTFTAIQPEADIGIYGQWDHLLAKTAHRIQHLYVRIRKQETLRELSKSLPTKLPMLQTLYLHVVLASTFRASSEDDEEDDELPERIQFAAMDSLQSLSLRNTDISWTQINFQVLRELTISEPSEITEEELMKAFQSMKQLRSFSITDPNIVTFPISPSATPSPDTEPAPIHRRDRAELPNLVELKIYDAYCDNIAIIFSLLDAPHLEKLVLRGAKESPEAWNPGGILGFHIFYNLQQMAISDLPLHDAVLNDLNRVAPNLTYLAAYFRDNTKLVRDFTSGAGASTETMIFPHLKELTTRNLPMHTLKTIVEIRKPRIERINVHITDVGIQLPPFSPETSLSDLNISFEDFEEDSAWLKENVERLEVFGLLVEGWGKADRYRNWEEWYEGRRVGPQDVTVNEHTLVTWS